MIKILFLHQTYISLKIPKPKNFMKTVLQDEHFLISQYYATFLLIALHSIFINGKIHYTINMIYLDISRLYIAFIYYYCKPSLVM